MAGPFGKYNNMEGCTYQMASCLSPSLTDIPYAVQIQSGGAEAPEDKTSR
jgi:hypothetical protein